MYKLNLIAVVGIVAAVSLVVGMASPAAVAFADDNSATMNMDNMALMGGMTGGNSTTSTTTMINGTSAPNDNVTMNMGNNMSSMGNMTGGGNATSMAETESLPSASETGEPEPGCQELRDGENVCGPI